MVEINRMGSLLKNDYYLIIRLPDYLIPVSISIFRVVI